MAYSISSLLEYPHRVNEFNDEQQRNMKQLEKNQNATKENQNDMNQYLEKSPTLHDRN